MIRFFPGMTATGSIGLNETPKYAK